MSLLYSDSATRLRAPFVTDPYGNPSTVRDWGSASELPLVGIALQPDFSTEDDGDRSTVMTGWRLFTPRGRDLDLLPGDRILLQSGVTTEVEGEVGRFTLRGGVHHIEARLRRVDG